MLHEEIKQLRLKLGLSIEKFGHELEISTKTAAKLESGPTDRVQADTLLRLREWFRENDAPCFELEACPYALAYVRAIARTYCDDRAIARLYGVSRTTLQNALSHYDTPHWFGIQVLRKSQAKEHAKETDPDIGEVDEAYRMTLIEWGLQRDPDAPVPAPR